MELYRFILHRKEKPPAYWAGDFSFDLLILFGFVQIRNQMFLTVLIVAVGVDGLAIALAGDIELFAEADIPQVTCPAAGGLYLQKKTIIFRVVKAVPAHPEVGEELTLIEIEKGGFINLCLYRIESKLA